jgi:hypothetical protein
VSYFKSNGITSLEKYVNVEHQLIATIFLEEMNINMKIPIQNKLATFNFLRSINPFKNDNVQQK